MTAAAHEAALDGRVIMLVEDEFFQAADLARALSEAGARLVGPLPTLDAALAALENGVSVDVAVLDINLRGQMVYPVAQMLERRGIPFLFATGYDRSVLPTSLQDVQVLEKPYQVQNLVAAVAELCRTGR